MKSKILFFLIVVSSNIFAQKIDEDQVPKDVLIGLETIYPEVSVKDWEIIEGNYFADIKVDGQSGKAEITSDGKWIISKFPVGEKELPSNIVKFFYDSYAGYKIAISQYIEEPDDNNYYYLKIQKKGLNQEENGELFFDLKGKLTKNTAPEIVKANPITKKEDAFEEDQPVKSKKKKIEADDSENEAKSETEPEQKVKPVKTVKTSKKKIEEDEESSTGNVDVPVNVKKYFDKKFPRSEDIEWAQNDSNFIATFFFHEMEQKAEFAPDGKMVGTTTIMDPKNIFRPIENYLMKKYDKYKVVKGEKVMYERTYQKLFPEKKLKNYYYVEISQKVKGSKIPKITKLWFDAVGAIDRIVEGDMEEENDYGDDDRQSKHDKKFKNELEE